MAQILRIGLEWKPQETSLASLLNGSNTCITQTCSELTVDKVWYFDGSILPGPCSRVVRCVLWTRMMMCLVSSWWRVSHSTSLCEKRNFVVWGEVVVGDDEEIHDTVICDRIMTWEAEKRDSKTCQDWMIPLQQECRIDWKESFLILISCWSNESLDD